MPDHVTEYAREALGDIAADQDIGELIGVTRDDEGVITVQFASRHIAYPGWRWTVSMHESVPGELTVLESELVPGEGALVAPEWVPWSVRLEEYKKSQAASSDEDAVEQIDDEDDDSADADPDIDSDDDDDEDDVDDLFGDDDVDGVDIDSLGADATGPASESTLTGADD